jgi:hypothetical protein
MEAGSSKYGLAAIDQNESAKKELAEKGMAVS